MGEGGWPILKRKQGDATNFPPAAVYILGPSYILCSYMDPWGKHFRAIMLVFGLHTRLYSTE